MRSIMLMAAAIAPVAAPTAALAAGPLEVRSAVLVEARQQGANGTTRVTLVAAAKVVPGDRVVYVISYRNAGAQPLGNVVLADRLPPGLAYRAPGAGSPAPEVSVDGATFATLAQLRVTDAAGVARAATAADITHVRWRLAPVLAAGVNGQVSFQAVLK